VIAMQVLLRQSWAALRLLLVLTVGLGLLYPFAVLAVGLVVPERANGSLLPADDGTVVGSSLLGQPFTGDEWFLPRPSVAGEGYDALASGASNLGPNNADLLEQVQQRQQQIAAREGVPLERVPPDAVTASGSGLDPHISPEYARIQVPRVAAARDLPQPEVAALVERHVQGRDLGFIGAPRVNVLELNLALQQLADGLAGNGRD
jgi:K+-transporting ATPase ATPase C chain